MNTIFINPLKDAIYVFGSNLAGQHDKGTAAMALKYYGAQNGCGEGFKAQSYALPVKDINNKTLSLSMIQAYVRNFLAYARERKDLFFMVTRIGCDSAGFRDEDIAPLFSRIPDNVWLPGRWLMKLNHLDRARLVVHGDPEYLDSVHIEQSLISSTKFWNNKFEVITDTLEGPSKIASIWSRKEDIPWTPFPADYAKFGVDAERIKYFQMSWYGTHAIAYWDGRHCETKSFIDWANSEGLRLQVNSIMDDVNKLELVG